MLKFGSFAALFLLLLSSPSTTDAFVKPTGGGGLNALNTSSSTTTTQVNVFGFLNEGKKALVKSLAGEYDQTAIQDRMNGLIDTNPVFMFSFTTWPFCIKAKEVLDDLKVDYQVVELDVDPDGKAIRAEMADMIDRTSVPAIWIGGQFVGGCNDGPMGGIVKLQESGELIDLLKGVGAL